MVFHAFHTLSLSVTMSNKNGKTDMRGKKLTVLSLEGRDNWDLIFSKDKNSDSNNITDKYKPENHNESNEIIDAPASNT